MPRFKKIITLIFCMTAGGFSACAGLVLDYIGVFNEMAVYRDHSNQQLYYYTPGKINLASSIPGKPDVKFLQMRYSGSQATGDQGKFLFKSLLQFRVNFEKMSLSTLDSIRKVAAIPMAARFEMLPIQDVKAALVYAPVENPAQSNRADGYLENESDEAAAEKGFAWNEKTFTVSLDNATSQLFWDALEKGNTVMSFSYEYYVQCYITGKESILNITAEGLNADSLRSSVVGEYQEPDSIKFKSSKTAVYSNTSTIRFNAKEHPELLVKIDINESRVPPDFPVMEVRCYDFDNGLAGDLYAKRIEIEASGMNNNPVLQKTTFYHYENAYCKSIRFPYAVKMGLPYRYRIVQIWEDGSQKYSQWVVRKTWTGIIDITKNNL
ncbi:MAG: hypothetical protein ACK560_11105 [Bacteroidota bacterium]